MLDQADSSHSAPWQFSLRAIFLFTAWCAFVAAGGHYLGWLGALCAAVLIAIWFTELPIWARAVAFCCCLVLFSMFLLPPNAGSGYSKTAHCASNLDNLEEALQRYAAEHGHFPPAYIADAAGRPLHSWRVLILPYLQENSLYQSYHFDEPWNGPHNSQLGAKCPAIFRCPSDAGAPTDTSYVAVVGPGTAWPGADFVSFAELASRGGAANTIQLVEASNSGIRWLEPRDLDFSTMSLQLNGASSPCACSNHASGVTVATADGSVHRLPKDLPASVFRDLLIARPGKTATFATIGQKS